MGNPTHILSVDPGLSGALCLISLADRSIQLHDMPVKDGQVDGVQLAAIVDLLKCQGDIVAVVERVGSLPRQAGAFNFGRSVGVVHGVFDALGIHYELVAPSQWKGACGLHRGPTEKPEAVKTRARELAQKLWPAQAGLFSRVKDDGRAESALLGRHYATKKGWLL